MWPGFKSRCRRHLWVEFVAGFSLATTGFSPGTPVFPSPLKPTFSISNLIRNRVDEEPLCGCATFKSLYYYYYYYYYYLYLYFYCYVGKYRYFGIFRVYSYEYLYFPSPGPFFFLEYGKKHLKHIELLVLLISYEVR